MNTRTTRFVLRRLVAGSALATWLASASALAQDHDFDLPAQPMASALTSLAQQGQLQVLFDEAQLRDVRAPALKGRYSPRLALERLLSGTGLELVEAGDGFVVRRRVQQASADNALQLDAQTVVGNGTSVDSSSVGRSTLTRKEIERQQADNVPSLLQTLPGVTMGGSAKPGGQTVNIWGLGDAEDVPFTLDGASKSGFERYQQGTVFIEPELIKRIEVEKGPYSVFTGNAASAAPSTWRPRMPPTCWRMAVTSAPCSSTATTATTSRRSTAAPSTAAPRTVVQTAWPTSPPATAAT